MKHIFVIYVFIVSILSSYSSALENLYVTKCFAGATVNITSEYWTQLSIDSVYSIERDASEVVLRCKSGMLRFNNKSIINIVWIDHCESTEKQKN